MKCLSSKKIKSAHNGLTDILKVDLALIKVSFNVLKIFSPAVGLPPLQSCLWEQCHPWRKQHIRVGGNKVRSYTKSLGPHPQDTFRVQLSCVIADRISTDQFSWPTKAPMKMLHEADPTSKLGDFDLQDRLRHPAIVVVHNFPFLFCIFYLSIILTCRRVIQEWLWFHSFFWAIPR